MSESQRPGAGLPPVTPPSGRFIAQLFLVPGTIVFLSVLLLMLFRYLFGGGHTTDQFLKQLDNPNSDIRWRGAADLAQVLEKQESVALRADVNFALELTDRLQKAVRDLDIEEKKIADEIKAENLDEKKADARWAKTAPQRNYVRFLIATAGRFSAPVALPVLAELTQREQGPDPNSDALLRRHTLWILAVMGDHLKKFDKVPPEFRSVILAELKKQAEGVGPNAQRSRAALAALDKDYQTADRVAVDQILAKVAKADDPYLREHVALACLFWDGPMIEPTLLLLARDDGHGTMLRVND